MLPEEVKQKGRAGVMEAPRGRRSIPGRGNCICKGPVVGRSLAGDRKDCQHYLLFVCVILCY